MPVFVSKKRERVTDPENPEQWIEIKAKLSRGDEATYKDWLTRLNPTDGGSGIDITTVDWSTPLLKLAIVDWHIQDPDNEGQWIAFNPALITDFDPDSDSPLVDAVLQRINDLNPFFGYKTRPSEPSGTSD